MPKVTASLREENPWRTLKRWIKYFQSLVPTGQEKLFVFRCYNPCWSMEFGAVGEESVTVIDTQKAEGKNLPAAKFLDLC